MTDHRATVKMGLDIYGRHYEHEMWINWNGDRDDGVDPRVVEWFADHYWDARAKWDSANDNALLAEQERHERAELARLKAKYEPAAAAVSGESKGQR